MADLTRYLRAALSLHGMTAGAFARSLDPPVAEATVYGVAAGRKSSARVADAIAECIRTAGLTMPDGDDDPVSQVSDSEMIESGGEAPPVAAPYAHYRVVRFDRTSGQDVEVMADGLTHGAARDLAGQHRAADIEREHVVGYRVASGDLKAQAAAMGADAEDAEAPRDPVEEARRFVARAVAA